MEGALTRTKHLTRCDIQGMHLICLMLQDKSNWIQMLFFCISETIFLKNSQASNVIPKRSPLAFVSNIPHSLLYSILRCLLQMLFTLGKLGAMS